VKGTAYRPVVGGGEPIKGIRCRGQGGDGRGKGKRGGVLVEGKKGKGLLSVKNKWDVRSLVRWKVRLDTGKEPLVINGVKDET